MAGTLVVDTLKSGSSGPAVFQNTSGVEVGQLCRAWVNFNGVTTATIRASFNVSSVTRNATGDYTVNFTNALADANYAPVVTGCSFSTTDTTRIASIYGAQGTGAGLKSTSQVRVVYGSTSTVTFADCAEMNVAVFR